MQNLDLILTLTGGFAAALVFGYLTHRLGLSPIVGYLLAGIVVSPHTPGFVANTELAEQLAEIGVILLMFGVGLQFHFQEFWAVKRIALPGALIQSLATAAFGAVVTYARLGLEGRDRLWSCRIGRKYRCSDPGPLGQQRNPYPDRAYCLGLAGDGRPLYCICPGTAPGHI